MGLLEYNKDGVNVLDIQVSTLLYEYQKLDHKQRKKFDKLYSKVRKTKDKNYPGMIVGEEFDFWKDEEDLYDDLV